MSDAQFNMTAYKMAQVYLRAILENAIRAGHSLDDFNSIVSDRHGDKFSPYLQQLFKDISEGRIKIQGLDLPVRIMPTWLRGIPQLR
jgi:hypothetical protein